jgi:class 3 adenylate cyclase
VAELPSGTVTFLFTDLEGSTRLWQEHPEAMKGALARHDVIVRDVIEAHGGYVVKTTGDGFHAAFATASDAVDAAIDAQLGVGGPRATAGRFRTLI